MQEDLVGLEITDFELKQWTNLTRLNIKPSDEIDLINVPLRPSVLQNAEFQHNLYQSKFDSIIKEKTEAIFMLLGIVGAILTLIFVDFHWSIGAFLVFLMGWWLWYPIALKIGSFLFKRLAKVTANDSLNYISANSLGCLLDEVDKYNQVVRELVYNLDAIAQSQSPENQENIKERSELIKAFRSLKADLEKALTTERKFRENPFFIPKFVTSNFTLLKNLQLSQTGSNWEKLVNEALEIGLRVEEEMLNLRQDVL